MAWPGEWGGEEEQILDVVLSGNGCVTLGGSPALSEPFPPSPQGDTLCITWASSLKVDSGSVALGGARDSAFLSRSKAMPRLLRQTTL